MARLAQNGWPVVARSALDERQIAGVAIPQGVLAGDVATVLRYVALRFDAEVESLVSGWCWGWAEKRIGSGDNWSNHAAGCAIDLNAPRHPDGKRHTFTLAQRAAIRRIVNWCDGVVRWGGDFSGGDVDEMHFEVVGDRAETRALAAKIRKAEANMRSYTMRELTGDVPELRQGDEDRTGETQWVWRMQRLLGVDDDGHYGPKTAAALAERMAGDSSRSSTNGTKCYLPEWRRLFGLW